MQKLQSFFYFSPLMLNLFKKRKITIAIDGHSSCGKSTLARDLAKKLRYIYVDSGAMYRAVTLYFIWNEIDLTNEIEIGSALNNIKIQFKTKRRKNLCYLNGELVEDDIRSQEVSDMVSEVAAISQVRRVLVEQQKAFGEKKGIVMDGRDIGTVVFPNAELKIFVTANIEVRSHRRYLELKTRGKEVPFDRVKANLIKRDTIDSTRDDSPLRQADDAIVLDNSELSTKQQLQAVLKLTKMYI